MILQTNLRAHTVEKLNLLGIELNGVQKSTFKASVFRCVSMTICIKVIQNITDYPVS